ncbi:MAG: FAD-binding oxidoreductase [Nitrospinae bacterium]|nr:FAD-binding oxidoreductase [Nitrospinota bacterium]
MALKLDSFAQSIVADSGNSVLLSDERADSFKLGGKTPSVVVSPADHDALCRVLSRANEADLAVFPWGGGTGRGTGYTPDRYDVALSLERMSKGVEFLKDDLTAVVEAGMSVEDLNRLTDAEGQTAGLDPPHPGTSTVGGTVIADRSGPMRVRWGKARDRVMRMKVVLADGATHTYGALVVKNVTGYDMNRLLSGSWGTLAVVTELAIRLYKAPEHVGARAAGFASTDAAFKAARALMASPLMPIWAEVLDNLRIAALASDNGIGLPGPVSFVASFGDFEEGLNDQLARFEEILTKEGADDILRLEDEETVRLGRVLADPPGGEFSDSETLAFRASGRLDQLPRFAKAARRAAESGKYRCAISSHAGSGVLRCWLAPEDEGSSPFEAWRVFSSLCREGRDEAQARSVHLRMDSGPDSLKEQISLWGEDALEPAALQVMRNIKKTYDPKGTLSPGRFVGRM